MLRRALSSQLEILRAIQIIKEDLATPVAALRSAMGMVGGATTLAVRVMQTS
jgi:hypothetical protein